MNDAGLRAPRGYINVAPGVLNLHLSTIRAGAYPTYLWRIDGGYHLPFGRRLAVELGGTFEHLARPGLQRFRLAPTARIGGGSRRSFGYGLVRIGLELDHIDLGRFGAPTAAGFQGALGGGVLGMLHSVVSLGGEVYVDMVSAHRKTVAHLNICLFVGLWF